jgi:hypothetical protein
MLGRSLVCGCYAWEISPTPILVPALFLTKKQNKETETSNGPTGLNTEEPKIIIIIFFYFFIYLPDFLYSSKANVKFAV